jgi:hypothetical protein
MVRSDQHLREVEDDAARDGVNTFKTLMEVLILSLLSRTQTIALGQVEEARLAAIDTAGGLGSAFLSPDERVKSGRVALGMLTHTFLRLRTVIETPSEDGLH